MYFAWFTLQMTWIRTYSNTFPSVSFHRCRCVSVKCVERVLSVLEARVNVCRGEKDSEAVLGVWLPAPLPTPRVLPDRGALWPLAVGVEKDLGGIDV